MATACQEVAGRTLTIENAFARLKSTRRIATRYKQTTTAYAAFVSLTCVSLGLM
ncbi:MAG: hypothetical protein HYV95_03665 [Opitutae bacterium]|nr:hypothetical protein [Opitutae bacterium]